jgi:hypothetical protein
MCTLIIVLYTIAVTRCVPVVCVGVCFSHEGYIYQCLWLTMLHCVWWVQLCVCSCVCQGVCLVWLIYESLATLHSLQ